MQKILSQSGELALVNVDSHSLGLALHSALLRFTNHDSLTVTHLAVNPAGTSSAVDTDGC